jgi:hypothetical protein
MPKTGKNIPKPAGERFFNLHLKSYFLLIPPQDFVDNLSVVMLRLYTTEQPPSVWGGVDRPVISYTGERIGRQRDGKLRSGMGEVYKIDFGKFDAV